MLKWETLEKSLKIPLITINTIEIHYCALQKFLNHLSAPFPGGAARECMVRSCAVHGSSIHQWAARHRGKHPSGNRLYQQRLVSVSILCAESLFVCNCFSYRWPSVNVYRAAVMTGS